MPALNNLLPQIVYILCALTSLACAVLLVRGYVRSKARILLWSALCFVFLFANNVFLYLDVIILPWVNLTAFRDITSFLAAAILVWGLIWDTD
jgi:hypothetical protein